MTTYIYDCKVSAGLLCRYTVKHCCFLPNFLRLSKFGKKRVVRLQQRPLCFVLYSTFTFILGLGPELDNEKRVENKPCVVKDLVCLRPCLSFPWPSATLQYISFES